MFVLTDTEGEGSISKTPIGPLVRAMTAWNVFTLPVVLNFGLIGGFCRHLGMPPCGCFVHATMSHAAKP